MPSVMQIPAPPLEMDELLQGTPSPPPRVSSRNDDGSTSAGSGQRGRRRRSVENTASGHGRRDSTGDKPVRFRRSSNDCSFREQKKDSGCTVWVGNIPRKHAQVGSPLMLSLCYCPFEDCAEDNICVLTLRIHAGSGQSDKAVRGLRQSDLGNCAAERARW
jgi:hypothetical protein